MNTMAKLMAAAGLLVTMVANAAPVNINTADAKTLAKELKGVGATKAESIVKDRAARGEFKSAQDITRVEGVGKSIYDQNKDNIKVKD